MTAPSYRFFNTPEYQEKLAKLSREERRVLGSFLADDSEAEREMKTNLALMELGGQEKMGNRSLDLQERRQSENLGLQKESLTQRERLSRNEMSAREAIARRRMDLNENLSRAQFDFERGQLPWATGIGLADVAIGGVSGYAKMRQDEETAEALRKLVGAYGRW